MNGRIYDPAIARFMSADPIIQDPTHGQSYNRYTYVWNNPTNLTDPTGFAANNENDDTGSDEKAEKIKVKRTVKLCEQDSTCKKIWDKYFRIVEIANDSLENPHF